MNHKTERNLVLPHLQETGRAALGQLGVHEPEYFKQNGEQDFGAVCPSDSSTPCLVHTGELYLDSFGVKRAKGPAPGAHLMCSSHRGTSVPRPAPGAVLGRSPEVSGTWTSCAQHLLLCSLKSSFAPVDSASKIATTAAAQTIKR